MTDRDLRHTALSAVQRLWRRHGDAVPFAAISRGFPWRGERIPFFSTFEGVYKPKQLQVGALSVRTTIASRYDDERISDDWVWYDYSPLPVRNDWLRECMEYGLPLLYFLQVKPKPGVEYLIFAPVEVLGAYGRRCSVCDLGESPVLDGAHLVPDREEPTRVLTGFHGRGLRLPDAPDLRPDPELVELRRRGGRTKSAWPASTN